MHSLLAPTKCPLEAALTLVRRLTMSMIQGGRASVAGTCSHGAQAAEPVPRVAERRRLPLLAPYPHSSSAPQSQSQFQSRSQSQRLQLLRCRQQRARGVQRERRAPALHTVAPGCCDRRGRPWWTTPPARAGTFQTSRVCMADSRHALLGQLCSRTRRLE